MKTLIFDFDGTIADSFELALEIAYELTGVDRLSSKEITRLRQLPLTKVIRELHVPVTRIPRLIFKGRQKMHERINEIYPFDGIAELLEKLHGRGYSLLVISSNSEQNVRAFLATRELDQYFDGVYGSASILNKATTLRKVLRKNNIEPDSCYYIGDEVRDIVAANKVNVDSIAVAWGYQSFNALAKRHPYAIVKKPDELLKIFTSSNQVS